MNGTLSHVTNTLIETLGGGETIESLTKSAVDSPRGQIQMFCVFYMLALWMFGKAHRSHRQAALFCAAGGRRLSCCVFCFGPRNNANGSG